MNHPTPNRATKKKKKILSNKQQFFTKGQGSELSYYEVSNFEYMIL